MAYAANRGRLAIVRVPKPEDEARRQLDREIEALQKERGVHGVHIENAVSLRLACPFPRRVSRTGLRPSSAGAAFPGPLSGVLRPRTY